MNTTTTMWKFYSCFLALVSFSGFVASFAPPSAKTTAGCASTTELAMSSSPSSRRDLFQQTGAAAIALGTSTLIQHPREVQAISLQGPMTEQSALNKANEGYQGVYFDPNHPDGYRIIQTSSKTGKTTMTLSDGVPKGSTEEAKTYTAAVTFDGKDSFVFDFSFKGGPKNLKATLSQDKQSLAFEDGNVWTKNYYKYDGIYKVTSGPGSENLSKDAYRVIRKKRPDILLEVNDTGNPADSKFVDGAIGSLFSIPTSEITFYYNGKGAAQAAASYSAMDALYDFQRGNAPPTTNEYGGTVGQLSFQDRNTVFSYGTITFPDKTVWTRI